MFPFKTLLSAVGLLLFADLATADENNKKLFTPLLESGQTIIGEPIAYPTGTPKITGAIVFLAPGKETGWHIHSVPLFAYVLQGELTVDYGEKGVKVYKAGDAFLEVMNWPLNGVNKETVPALILAVFMGAEGIPPLLPSRRRRGNRNKSRPANQVQARAAPPFPWPRSRSAVAVRGRLVGSVLPDFFSAVQRHR